MFSVIIPVYNGEKYIDNAIESVLNQTVSDWELIIVNDGSSDNTASVLEKYREYKKICVITQENQGVSVARNNGVNRASGDYITFLDADDIWHYDHLEVMQTLSKEYPDAGLIGTFTKTELVNGDVIEECDFFKDKQDVVYTNDFFELYHKDKSSKMFTMITTCISKEAFYKAGGFPVGCKIGEDLELSLKIAAYYPVVLSKKATATYKKENSSATKNRSFDADWGFFDTVLNIYNDESIPLQKRENLKKVMNWFTLRRCRHYIIEGKRKKAIKAYFATDKRITDKKDLLINTVLLMLPSKVAGKIFEVRWRGKA